MRKLVQPILLMFLLLACNQKEKSSSDPSNPETTFDMFDIPKSKYHDNNERCNLDQMQNNYESITKCREQLGDLIMENILTTQIHNNANLAKDFSIINGEYTVLEYSNHSHAVNAYDVTGSVELAIIFDKKLNVAEQDTIKMPSKYVQGIGAIRGAWIGFCQFKDLVAKLKVVEISKNSIQLEIIDTIYSKNGVSFYSLLKEDNDQEYKMFGKIRFVK